MKELSKRNRLILEGGLAENAAVMSWRGVQGGIEAAKDGHPVVMWTHIARTEAEIDAQIFPRLNALVEVLWTNPEQRDFADFNHRLHHR